jgi:hypothetical protein
MRRRGNGAFDATASLGLAGLINPALKPVLENVGYASRTFLLFSYREALFNVGSRTDNRDTFFCVAKRKYPKKRQPGCRVFPALLGFERGFPKGLPSPCGKRDASLHRPYRAIPLKPSGARRGITGEKPSQIQKHYKNVGPISEA